MKSRISARQAAALFAVLLLSTAAHAAGLFRAYLASDGSDANPCTLAQPCRLLPAALAAVADGGGIWMLDSANYNTSTVNIAKSVTILAVPGAVGSVLAIGGPAISISGGVFVAVRNLVIAPLPGSGGTDGISMVGSSGLAVENSVFENLDYSGIHAAGNGVVAVTDSVFRNIGGYAAILLENGIDAQIAATRMLNNGVGVHVKATAAGNTRATLTDCVIRGSVYGVHSYANIAGASAGISITRSTIGISGSALRAESLNTGAAEILIGSSQVHNNIYRWEVLGGSAAVASYGNNQFSDYLDTVGSLTSVGLE